MTLRTLALAALRRWYVTLLGLLATAGLAIFAGLQVPPQYTVEANVVLLPPQELLGEGENPYLALAGLSQVVEVLVRSLESDSYRDVEDRYNSDVTIARDNTTSGPVLIVTVEAPSEDAAAASLEDVLGRVPIGLADLQSSVGVQEEDQVYSRVLSQESETTAIMTPTIRAVIVASALGVVATLLLVAIVDGVMMRRETRGPKRRTHRAPVRPT